MSEPNTSEPLHSSCTRQVMRASRIGEARHVAEHVDRDAADRRQEHVQVGPRHELREHAAGLLEQRAAQLVSLDVEALRDAGQIPDRIDRDLGDRDVAVWRARRRRRRVRRLVAERGEIPAGQPRLASRRCWAGCRCPRRSPREILGDAMAPGIERHDLPGSLHCGNGPIVDGRRGIGKIGPADRIERAGRDRERAIERVGAAMRCQ